MRTVTALGLLVLLAGPAAALELPSVEQQRAQDVTLLQEVGARPDRVLVSVVPGPVVNDERVRVLVGPSGAVARVEVEQRLRLTGEGDYQVRERGPARASEALGDEPPPVTKFGVVVWQGFSPGERELAARLVLDPLLEAPRLPLALEVSGPVDLGGRVTGPGRVVVRLVNRTEQPATVPTAADAPAGPVAAALDAARRAAARDAQGTRLPAAGAGLPARVPTTGDAQAQGTTGVPLRVTGALRLLPEPGAAPDAALGTVTGPATTPVPGGADVGGTLPPGASAELVVEATGPSVLDLSLVAAPALDPRTLVPPGGAPTWAAWAAAGPPAEQRRAALDLLVQTAATGARATSYSPYLGADLPGTGTTTFRYGFAPLPEAAAVEPVLRPRPGPIAAVSAAVLLLLVSAGLLWRAS